MKPDAESAAASVPRRSGSRRSFSRKAAAGGKAPPACRPLFAFELGTRAEKPASRCYDRTAVSFFTGRNFHSNITNTMLMSISNSI